MLDAKFAIQKLRNNGHWFSFVTYYLETGSYLDSNTLEITEPKSFKEIFDIKMDTTLRNLTEFRKEAWRFTVAKGRHLRQDNGVYKLAWK